ncbi:DUF6350 family protein [Rhodococcus sp. IEGM 1408]|uniref:cell division protein PerM n=1 Tax=Rhodococcus sp. IEGM 1408 TaxID=3082220 RepID=UPI0029540053|nr:DUF6350 family protein [Rhodococcus sp. IEGM 1408]MDV8001152.1 DUF6350 family protein [Rhodococcus sp. IEGM 1408]
MSPPRVIRPAARRAPAGARSLLWTAAAAALPVIVTVLVLIAVTLGLLVFTARGFESLFAVVAVEWLVVNRVPLTVDSVTLGFLPLLPPLLYVAVLARQTRAVLSDIEQPGPREAGATVAGVTVAGLLLTTLASLLVGSAASDFAVREVSLTSALLWTVAVGAFGSGLGVWLYFRRDLREILPLWVRGGIHLGAAFVAATCALATVLVLVGLVLAWEPVGSVLEIGKGLVGTAALTAISAAYLPNVVVAATTVVVGGEAHLGAASYSVFAVSRGPMPEVPLAAALPTTDPHWVVQGLLLVTVLMAAGLARSVAHWFRSTADAVKAAWLAAAIVALVMAVSPVVAGGELGALGTIGTGSLIAAGTALLLFGVIGSATIALSLAGLTRRRERAESELDRRRRRAGTVGPEMPGEPAGDPAVEASVEPAPGSEDYAAVAESPAEEAWIEPLDHDAAGDDAAGDDAAGIDRLDGDDAVGDDEAGIDRLDDDEVVDDGTAADDIDDARTADDSTGDDSSADREAADAETAADSTAGEYDDAVMTEYAPDSEPEDDSGAAPGHKP